MKKEREKLEEEHRRLKEAQTVAHVGSFEWDAATNVIYWSDEMYRIHGLAPQSETISFKKELSFLHPDDPEDWKDNLIRLKQEPGSLSLTHRIKRADGEERFVIRQLQSFADEKGKVFKVSGIVQDITEQHRIDEQIKEQSHYLQRITDTVPDMISVMELETKKVDCLNPDIFIANGFNPELLKIMPREEVAQLVHKDDRQELNEFYQKLGNSSDDDIVTAEYRAKDLSGTWKWFSVRARVFERDETGKVTHSLNVIENISWRKKAEEKINEHSHFIDRVARSTPDVITIYDLNGQRITYINHALPQMLGFTGEELMSFGKQLANEMIHPAEQTFWQEDKRAIVELKDGEVKDTVLRIKDKKGDWHYINSKTTVFKRSEKGEVTEVLSISRDVTKEYGLQKQLVERTQFVEALVDNSIDRIMACDKNFIFTAWSKRCEEIYGITKAEALGTSFFKHFPRIKENELLMEAMNRAQAGEMVHLPPRKEIYREGFGEIYYIPLKNEEGSTYGILSVMHDVTRSQLAKQELKALNKTLERKNVELERRSEEVASFAFVASHDLREPLRKIHTFSDWLLTNENNLSSQGKNYLDRMGQSVSRLNLLINDILALTQIHTIKETIERVDLNEALLVVKQEMNEWIEEKKAIIESEKLPVVNGIKQQILHLFRNLLSNAFKFQKEGSIPHVIIKSEITESKKIPKSNMRGKYFKVGFTDNGIGFDSKYKKKIFEIFQRLNPNYFQEGTGIGLAICKKVMENHGGSIVVESKLGKGSTFFCFFPVV